jgi:hypothetical protein
VDQPAPRRLDEAAAIARGGQLSELAAHVHSALADLVLLAASFDSDSGWAAAGIRSCAHWLSINAGLDLHTSADLLRIGHALADLPLIRQAFASGQLSLDKVRSLLRVANPANEQLWLELALGSDASQLSRICRASRRSMDADPDKMLAKRGLWTTTTESGMLRLVALLPPEDGALVMAALEAVATSDALPRTTADPEAPVPDPAEDRWAARRLEALKAVCEHALAAGPEELVSGPSPVQMVVHVDVGVLTGERPDGRCELEDGTPLSAAVARRLGCDAELVAITERDGLPIDVGRRRRLFTGRQRQALQARDRTCCYPGCTVPVRRTRAHHIKEWWKGGKTNLANGANLCNWHHGRLHEGAYRILVGDNGELRFETPDGVEIGPPRRAPLDAATGGSTHLRHEHEERGLEIGPETPVAGWGGEHFDLHYAADVYLEASAYARARAGPALSP